MLYDPRYDKPKLPPQSDSWQFESPSLEGFAAFVAMKAQADPDGGYDWSCGSYGCAVGQYLTMIGAYEEGYDDDWEELVNLAQGTAWRDRRGRYTSGPEEVMLTKQWTWQALAKRIATYRELGFMGVYHAGDKFDRLIGE